MLAKRSYNTAKNMANRTLKSKEPSSSKTPNRSKQTPTTYNMDFLDFEPKSPTFPHIKSSENTDVLPCYASVLTKSAEEGINMKDLDQLQQELEKLLSMCSVRARSLYQELDLLDKNEERHEKKAKFDRPTSPKIRKIEEKKIVKEKPFKLIKNVHDELPKVDVPKVVIPKNDTKSKFWASIDPYCAPIDSDDIAFLDDLIQEVNTDIDIKIPPLGPHYTHNWNGDTVSNHFQGGIVNFQHSKNKLVSMLTDDSFFKNQKNGIKDSYTTSLLLPLASALLEEKVVNNFPASQEKIEKFKDLGIRNLSNSSVCLDKRMRKELVDLGILNNTDEDIKPPLQTITPENEDQILEEIKKCQQELVTVNEHNKRELNHLRYLIDKDMLRQELNEKLDKVDGQIMDVCNRLLNSENKDNKVDIEWEAVKIIQLQRKLHKEAMELTDVRL